MTSLRSRVVGLDLSLTATGIANLRGRSALLHRLGSQPAGGRWPDRHARLEALAEDVIDLVGPRPALVVLEAPAYGSKTGQVHDRAGYWWSVYGRLRGHEVPVLVVAPAKRAKYATGRGTAGKDEVLAAVVRRYGWAEVGNNDHADALVLAAMGARLLGEPVEEWLPQAHLAAMDGLSLADTM